MQIKESERNRKSAKVAELVKPSEVKVYLFLIGTKKKFHLASDVLLTKVKAAMLAIGETSRR